MQPSDEAKSVIAGVFSRASATYGQVGPRYFTYFGQRLVERMQLARGMRVLDVACGRGAALFPAAEAVGSSGSVTGIDLSPGMVDATNAEIRQRGIQNATAQVMDAEQLAFPDDAFDAVICAFGIFLMPDRAAALAEFRRVLRPGGRVGISTWAPDVIATEKARWGWYDELLKRYLPPSGGSPVAQRVSAAGQMDSPEQLIARLGEVGYTHVSVQGDAATFTYATAEDWWQERWSLFFRLPLERLSPESLAMFQAEALTHAREMQMRGELITELNALYTIGYKPAST